MFSIYIKRKSKKQRTSKKNLMTKEYAKAGTFKIDNDFIIEEDITYIYLDRKSEQEKV